MFFQTLKHLYVVFVSTVVSYWYFSYFGEDLFDFSDQNFLFFSIVVGISCLILLFFERKLLFRINIDGDQAVSGLLRDVRFGGFLGVVFLIVLSSGEDTSPIFFLLSITALCVIFFVDLICPRYESTSHAPLRFAFDAVGKDDDKFNYVSVAAAEAQKIIDFPSGKVEVYVLSGRQGSGKSSFQRMMIEHMDQSKMLYTYLSLTEANNDIDIGKLFNKRWTQTLSERYPVISGAPLPLALEDIIHIESDFWISAFKSLPSFLPELIYWYGNFIRGKDKPQRLSKEVSQVFENLTNIKEIYWIVVFDEIDRAPFSEVYRIIEIIERMKSLSQNGLPVRLVFLCVVDEDELRKRILSESRRNGGDVAQLCETFFFGGGIKIANWRIFLPAISLSDRRKHLEDSLLELIRKYDFGQWGAGQEELLQDVSPIPPNVDGGFAIDKKGKLTYAISSIASLVPRAESRVLVNIERTLNSFSSSSNKYPAPFFDISEVLLLGYAQFSITKFHDFIAGLTGDQNDPQAGLRRAFSSVGDEKEKKFDELLGDVFIEEEDRKKAREIINVICPTVRQFVNGDTSYQNEAKSAYSLERPGNLRRYLRLAWNEEVPELETVSFLENLEGEKLVLRDLAPEAFTHLIEYTSFVRGTIKDGTYTALVDEAFWRIKNGQFPIDPLKYDNSERDRVIVSLFRITSTLRTLRKFELARTTFQKLLQSTDLSVGEIYRCINWFVKTDRPNHVVGPFQEVIETWPGGEDAFKREVAEVISKCLERMKSFEKTSIYDSEPHETIQFTLYQSWTQEDNKEELSILRTIAAKDLEKHPEVLEKYWDAYLDPRKEGEGFCKNIEDSARYIPHAAYLPLWTLVEKSEQCDGLSQRILDILLDAKVCAKSQKYKDFVERQISEAGKTETTIHGYLIQNGFIKKPHEDRTL